MKIGAKHAVAFDTANRKDKTENLHVCASNSDLTTHYIYPYHRLVANILYIFLPQASCRLIILIIHIIQATKSQLSMLVSFTVLVIHITHCCCIQMCNTVLVNLSLG